MISSESKITRNQRYISLNPSIAKTKSFIIPFLEISAGIRNQKGYHGYDVGVSCFSTYLSVHSQYLLFLFPKEELYLGGGISFPFLGVEERMKGKRSGKLKIAVNEGLDFGLKWSLGKTYFFADDKKGFIALGAIYPNFSLKNMHNYKKTALWDINLGVLF